MTGLGIRFDASEIETVGQSTGVDVEFFKDVAHVFHWNLFVNGPVDHIKVFLTRLEFVDDG